MFAPPGVGVALALANAAISHARGQEVDWVDVALSAVPGVGIAAKAFGAGAKALGIIGQATRVVGALQSVDGVRDAVAHGAGIPQLIDGARRLARGDVGGGFAALADGAIGLAGAAGSIKGAASLAGRHSHCQERRIFPWTRNQNSCFTAGTPLKRPDGSSKPIEQFAVGDAILTKDEFRPESGPVAGVVVDTFARVSEVLHVRVQGVTIEATAEHPLWVVGRGWIPVAEVLAGDRLLTSDGRAVECEGVGRPGRVATVYNVTVSPGHTYFVGHEVWGFDAWAHNAACKVHLGADPKYRKGWNAIFGKPKKATTPSPSKYTGGRHGTTKGPVNDGMDSHHMPAKSASPLHIDEGPAIKMDPADHRLTASHGSQGLAGAAYRAQQKKEIDAGRFGKSIQMDIDDVRGKFGIKYNTAIRQMIAALDPWMRTGLKG